MDIKKYWYGEENEEGETEIHYSPTPPGPDDDPPLEIENPCSDDIETMSERCPNDVQTMFGRSSNDVQTLPKRNQNASQTANATLKRKLDSYVSGDKAMDELNKFPEIKKCLQQRNFIENLTGGMKLETLEVTKNKEVAEFCAKFGASETTASRLVLEARIDKEHRGKMRYFKILIGLISIIIVGWTVSPKLKGETINNTITVEDNENAIDNPVKYAQDWAAKNGARFTDYRLKLLEDKLRGLSPTLADKVLTESLAEQNRVWKK